MIDGAELLRFLAAFAVIGLALFAFAFVSRSGGRVGALLRRSDRIVAIIETTPLPHASSLHVVKIGDAYFVIGRTNSAISLLSEVPADIVARRSAEEHLNPKGLLTTRPR